MVFWKKETFWRKENCETAALLVAVKWMYQNNNYIILQNVEQCRSLECVVYLKVWSISKRRCWKSTNHETPRIYLSSYACIKWIHDFSHTMWNTCAYVKFVCHFDPYGPHGISWISLSRKWVYNVHPHINQHAHKQHA